MHATLCSINAQLSRASQVMYGQCMWKHAIANELKNNFGNLFSVPLEFLQSTQAIRILVHGFECVEV